MREGESRERTTTRGRRGNEWELSVLVRQRSNGAPSSPLSGGTSTSRRDVEDDEEEEQQDGEEENEEEEKENAIRLLLSLRLMRSETESTLIEEGR